jgi:hypothetical protein
MQINKPPHNRYALSFLDNATYAKYATVYSGCKRWGVRGVYSFLCGTGLVGVAKEVAKGTIVQYGKRRIAVAVICMSSYISAPALAVITNATRVVKGCKLAYVSIGYMMEVLEDASQVPFLPLDLGLFGQLIPANTDGRFSSWDNIEDIIRNLPIIGD